MRGRVHTIRGKGKTAFLVLRQRTSTVQCVIAVDEKTVSRGMVKYATGISKESVVDIAGTVAVPANPVTSCSQSEVCGALASCPSHVSLQTLRVTLMPVPGWLSTIGKGQQFLMTVRNACIQVHRRRSIFSLCGPCLVADTTS